MVSRKVKFAAATVVDSFIRFRPRTALLEISTSAAPKVDSAIEDI
jgi:hypothetical protein